MMIQSFHRFGQAKFPYGGSILGSSQFSILPQLPPKIVLNSKVVKVDQKIIKSRLKSKSVTHSEELTPIKTLNENCIRRLLNN